MYKRNNSWYSDFWYEGERYTKAHGDISKTVAREKDRKFRTDVKEGRYQQKAKRIRFEKFAEKYLEAARVNKKPNSSRRNAISITVLTPHFKGKLLSSIYPLDVERYKKTRKEEGRMPATINRDVATLRNMLNMAVEWGCLRSNPIAGVKMLKEDNEKMWVLSPDEERQLLEQCAKSPQRGKKRYLKDLVLVALYSGMRQAEIFNLKKTRVSLSERYLLATDTKTHENRKVPINDTLLDVLQRRLDVSESEYVFCTSKGEKLTQLTNAFWYAIQESKLIKYNGDKKIRFRFHDLRHTFGSRLGMAGADLKTIMEIMGHKTTKVAMRYQHPMPDHKLKVVKTLDQIPSKSTTGAIYAVKEG